MQLRLPAFGAQIGEVPYLRELKQETLVNFLCLRFWALRACSSGSFYAITRTKPVFYHNQFHPDTFLRCSIFIIPQKTELG